MKDTTLTKADLRAENERLRAENERLRAHVGAQRKVLELSTCKILTCGVAAGHKDPALSRRANDYGGPWDSPQAQLVRELRDDRDRLLRLVRESGSDA